eukprot:1541850-Pyramimonas_sp.AAC.1
MEKHIVVPKTWIARRQKLLGGPSKVLWKLLEGASGKIGGTRMGSGETNRKRLLGHPAISSKFLRGVWMKRWRIGGCKSDP